MFFRRSTSFARALWKPNKVGDLACSLGEPTVARQHRTSLREETLPVSPLNLPFREIGTLFVLV